MTTRESGQICMAKLARISHRLAELDAERSQLAAEQAKVYDELADGETVDMTTTRRLQRPRRLVFDEPVLPEDDAKAVKTLSAHTNRRRLRS